MNRGRRGDRTFCLQIVNHSGNLDLCYYNFLCAHPALGLSDFNHVYSNVGYVLIGIVFLLVIAYRQSSVTPMQVRADPKLPNLQRSRSRAAAFRSTTASSTRWASPSSSKACCPLATTSAPASPTTSSVSLATAHKKKDSWSFQI